MIQNCKNIWLKKGSTEKNRIKELQTLLNNKGISKKAIGSNLAVDGDYGQVTEKVVTYSQKTLTLLPDGIVGPVTCDRLNKLTALPPLKPSDGWTRVYYTKSSQNTNYTCGPSSLRMGFSIYGLNITETWFKEKAGSNSKNGTSIEGMLVAVKAVNNTYNQKFKARNETFKSWETFKNYLVKGWPVILRVSSWLTPGGEHYVVLVGLNIESGQVELGDPSHSGFRSTTISDLRERIRKVNVPSVIVISK